MQFEQFYYNEEEEQFSYNMSTASVFQQNHEGFLGLDLYNYQNTKPTITFNHNEKNQQNKFQEPEQTNIKVEEHQIQQNNNNVQNSIQYQKSEEPQTENFMQFQFSQQYMTDNQHQQQDEQKEQKASEIPKENTEKKLITTVQQEVKQEKVEIISEEEESPEFENNSSNNKKLHKNKTKGNNNGSQSQFKNANKFFISNFINHLLKIEWQSPAIEGYIMGIKKTGKSNKKVDLFTLAHYRLFFLVLNQSNITQFNAQDIKLHSEVFKIDPDVSKWDQNTIQLINLIKSFLCSKGEEFFSPKEGSEIYEKIRSKNWNSKMEEGYLGWVKRISLKIKVMSTGNYIFRI